MKPTKIIFAGQPANGESVEAAGQKFTFVDWCEPADDDEILIGGSLGETIENFNAKVGPNFSGVLSALTKKEDRSTNTDKTGGTRYSAGKPGRFWCAPLYGLRLVSQVWTAGGDKYAPLDWQEGQSFASLFDCMSRHWLEIVQRGVWARDDSEGGTGAYHLGNLVWNALCLLTFMALGRDDLDDMSGWRGVTAAEAARWRAEHGDAAPPAVRGTPTPREVEKSSPEAIWSREQVAKAQADSVGAISATRYA